MFVIVGNLNPHPLEDLTYTFQSDFYYLFTVDNGLSGGYGGYNER